MRQEVLANRHAEFALYLGRRPVHLPAQPGEELQELVVDRQRILDHAGGDEGRVGREEVEGAVGSRLGQPGDHPGPLAVEAQGRGDVRPVALLGPGSDQVLDVIEPAEREAVGVRVLADPQFGHHGRQLDRGKQLRAGRVAFREPAVQPRADERVGGAVPVRRHGAKRVERRRGRGEVVGDPDQERAVRLGRRIEILDDDRRALLAHRIAESLQVFVERLPQGGSVRDFSDEQRTSRVVGDAAGERHDRLGAHRVPEFAQQRDHFVDRPDRAGGFELGPPLGEQVARADARPHELEQVAQRRRRVRHREIDLRVGRHQVEQPGRMARRRRLHQLVQFAAERPELLEQGEVAVRVLAPADFLLQRHRHQGRAAAELVAGQQAVALAALLDLDLALDHRDARSLDAVRDGEDGALDRHQHLLGRHDQRTVLLLGGLDDHAAAVDSHAMAAAPGVDAERGQSGGLDPGAIAKFEHRAAAGAGADPVTAVDRVAGAERNEVRPAVVACREHTAVDTPHLHDAVLGRQEHALAEPHARHGHADHCRGGRVVAAHPRRRHGAGNVGHRAAGPHRLQVLAARDALASVVLHQEALRLRQRAGDQGRHARLVVGAGGQRRVRIDVRVGRIGSGGIAGGGGQRLPHACGCGGLDVGRRPLRGDRLRGFDQSLVHLVAVAHRSSLRSSSRSFWPSRPSCSDPPAVVVAASSSASAAPRRLRSRCSVTATVMREVPIIGPISEFR